MKYDLTDKQKSLLEGLVEDVEAGRLEETIIPIETIGKRSILGSDRAYARNLVDNLEVFVSEGLLASRSDSRGNSMYSLRQSAYDAVKSEFEKPASEPSAATGVNIQNMSGGHVQGVGTISDSTVHQIVNDPIALDNQLNEMSHQLVEAVQGALDEDRLASYKNCLDAFRAEMCMDERKSPKLKGLLKHLSFMGDIEGSIELIARVLPIVTQLAVLARDLLAG